MKDELAYSANHNYREGYDDGRADAIYEFPKCKNCVHWKVLNLTQGSICEIHNWMSIDDDYCSLAERIKEQANE